MDETDEIKLKNCTVKGKVVACDMEREEYKKMGEPPNDLAINVEDEVPKNKSIDGTQATKADSSNKQECGCSKTTENSEIANFVAKYLINEEN